MGTNTGNGLGGPGNDMSALHGGHPHATEYTLQGVMRFLQTEWHRHERDRNAWEIEKQEMKGRIASLEGAVRRGDATQKALNKYVGILVQKVKTQQAQLQGNQADPPSKLDREAMIQAKLEATEKPPDGIEMERMGDDEAQRTELKTFLDQCQAEFSYLMITPANPLPPRESPPLPMIEDLREGEPFGLSGPPEPYPQHHVRPLQNHVRDRPAPMPQHLQQNNHHPPKTSGDVGPAPMVRSHPEMAPLFGNSVPDWPPAASVSTRLVEEGTNDMRSNSSELGEEMVDNKKGAVVDPDAWDFSDSSFPDPLPPQIISSTRPDTDVFPSADNPPKSPGRGPQSHRRKSSMSRRRSADQELALHNAAQKAENSTFRLRYGLRGHLNAVRAVLFSGGGSPGEPEICTAGDDGLIKRFHIPRVAGPAGSNVMGATSDLDVQADWTHRGHQGAVLCLASWSPSPNFATGGRAQGDGWIFSGGQDTFVRVWERGRVDPKATLDGHTDAVWALCVLPATVGSLFGQSSPYGPADRIILVSGAADGTVRVWAISSPPQLTSPQPAGTGRRGAGGSGRTRGNSMSSGSAFPSSPQPTVASNSAFGHTLIHTISRPQSTANPTSITRLGSSGETFVVSYDDASVVVYDTRTGETLGTMASVDTYDGSNRTGVNAVVASIVGLEQPPQGDDEAGGGPTGGGRSGVEGVIIAGHEDNFVRFFDANSGQCTYNMVAHPAAIAGLSLSPDNRELVSAGHDGSLRFWSLEKRALSQEIAAHRIMRGEGVCAVVWSQDGRWVVSSGGDGIVKIFAR